MNRKGPKMHNQQLDEATMAAVGFGPDGRGGWTRVGETPPQPGRAIRQELIARGLIFLARREAENGDAGWAL